MLGVYCVYGVYQCRYGKMKGCLVGYTVACCVLVCLFVVLNL